MEEHKNYVEQQEVGLQEWKQFQREEEQRRAEKKANLKEMQMQQIQYKK